MQQSEWLCMGFWAVAIGWGLVACLEYLVFEGCKWFLFGWAVLLWVFLWDAVIRSLIIKFCDYGLEFIEWSVS